MRVVEHVDDLRATGGVMAIGNFDGVHRGHRLLLDRMREVAVRRGVARSIVTFFPPAKVFFSGAPYLASALEKRSLLAAFEPDELVMQRFDATFAATDAQAFLDALARRAPHMIVVGEDFRFGRDRVGGLDMLQHVPERLEVIRLHHDGDDPISSSRIRAHLAGGDIEAANALLGAPYFAMGEVIHGDHRGRTIGYPTANVDLPAGKALPRGVYAVTVDVPDDARYAGMANVGPRPTFPGESPRLEAHLFDYAGDLYGRVVTVRFHAHLRDQRVFAGLDDLTQQLEWDALQARHALGRDGWL